MFIYHVHDAEAFSLCARAVDVESFVSKQDQKEEVAGEYRHPKMPEACASAHTTGATQREPRDCIYLHCLVGSSTYAPGKVIDAPITVETEQAMIVITEASSNTNMMLNAARSRVLLL